MCGIFALLNQNDISLNKNIENAFMLGKGRGPETSTFKKYNDLILGFHRLAIIGLNIVSDQPLIYDGIAIICNGEIYNYKNLCSEYDITLNTQSDCEIIIHLYKKYGIEYTLKLLDGVFALILFDMRRTFHKIYVCRDPYGVRPLFMMTDENSLTTKKIYGFASEIKILNALDIGLDTCRNIESFEPGTYHVFEKKFGSNYTSRFSRKYINFPLTEFIPDNIDLEIYYRFVETIKKRIVGTTERPVACLLSGGLDSSIVAGLVNKFYTGILETYSIGLAESEDLKFSSIVAKHLKTKHTQIIVTEQEFFDAIPEVIKTIETYDTTTIRASVGNYLIGKYIATHSDAKVIFNGDGADELMGGYLYFHKSPNVNEFDKECKRLLTDIHYFDVLRSDRCISSHGLEARTPFLDRWWVNFYLSLSKNLRYHSVNNQCEKYLFRHAFHVIDPDLIPNEILWRKKEAFSDGVSGMARPWFVIIEEKINNLCKKDTKLAKILQNNLEKNENEDSKYTINPPKTLEQSYYRTIYESHYAGNAHTIPYFWMPKYVDATDSSARTLKIY